ncbi:cytochrome P450 9e2-like [Leptopilina heterotoma]|uniref:cytochrome P450 9e2-like n=1 Tax=Leptopilina heterotoma TaxID=63436 RepID=UPI001CA8FBD7|nr:cytochrome P450 9e2-like [Leptopilina heterotoma]
MISISLILLTFIIGIIVLLSISRQSNIWKRNGKIPHLKPVPILGNTFAAFFLKQKSLAEWICEVYNRFSSAKYFGLVDFGLPVIVLRDAELIKDVCVKLFDHFPDHNNIIDEKVDPVWGKNVFALRGDRWREIRNTLSPSFTGSKMKFMYELVDKCSENFVNYYLKNSEEAKLVEMKDSFTRYTNDVIATAAFGIGVDSMKDKDNEFYLRGKDAMNFMTFFRMIKFFFFRFCPSVMFLIGEPFLSRGTNRFFKSLVRDTVETRKAKNIIRPDMIHLLIEASKNENGVEVTIDDMIAQSFIFFLAGFSTSATLMTFVAHELAVNQHIQEKLRKEIDSFTKGDSKISYDSLSKMKYLDMVISEALRKYPPAGVVDRLCVEKYTFSRATPDSEDYTIQPNSLIWLPIYALQNDPKYFPDPDKFDPERFNDENKDKINPYAYIPFGLGPRKCIGNRFALMETKILFVRILQHFTLETTDKTKYPVVFEKGFNVAYDGDFFVKMIKRTN